MKLSDDHENLLTGTRPPAASTSLKRRALAAARIAYCEPRPTLTDRLWSNRPLRLAWGMAVTLLLAVNVQMAVSPTAGNEQAPTTSSLAWQCVSNEHQLQPLTRRSGSTTELSLKELDRLLFEGPSNSLPARKTTTTKTTTKEGDRV